MVKKIKLRERIFLVIGEGYNNRKRALESINNRFIKTKISILNKYTYYASEIVEEKLRDTLLSVPLGGERVVILKQADKLQKEIRKFLITNLNNIVKMNYIILEIDKDYKILKRDKNFFQDELFAYLLKVGNVFKVSSYKEEASLNRLILLVREKRLAEALFLLDKVFEQETKKKPLLGMWILGAISREYALKRDDFEKKRCFNLIWETERAVKEGRLEQKIALQLLLTKLLLN